MPSQKMFYCSNKCRREYESNHYREWVGSDGYLLINGKRKHRLLMQDKIGRKLSSNEIVHHINGDILDNRIENLQIMTLSEHTRLHYMRKIKYQNDILSKGKQTSL